MGHIIISTTNFVYIFKHTRCKINMSFIIYFFGRNEDFNCHDILMNIGHMSIFVMCVYKIKET